MYNEGEVEAVLVRLGIESDQRNNEHIAMCPMHFKNTGKVDNNPSWSINADTGVHHCFSCSYRGTLLGLIADVLDISFEEAKSWLRQYTSIDVELINKRLEELKNSYVGPTKPVPMSEARLAVFDAPPAWALEARELTERACADYSIKWDSNNNFWVIPVRNPADNALLGWQEKGQKDRYFKNRPAGIPKSQSLFGYENLSGDSIVVVESPLDVVKMASWGYYIGVAIYGAVISSTQLSLISSAKNLVFAFDNPSIDKAGYAAAKNLIPIARKLGLEYSFFNYGGMDVKDVGDMTQDQFESGLLNARHCSLGMAALEMAMG